MKGTSKTENPPIEGSAVDGNRMCERWQSLCAKRCCALVFLEQVAD